MNEDNKPTEPQPQPQPQPQAQTQPPAPAQEQPPTQAQEQPPAPAQETLNHVLPPQKYKLKTFLMFSDFIVIFLYIYYLIIRSIIKDISDGTFSFVSNRMFSYYCIFAITAALLVFVFIFKMTKSVKTRYERDNEVRQNPNIKVWLCGFNWGWPILFVPTMVLMVIAGVLGLFLSLIFRNPESVTVIQDVIGGIVLVFGALNAAVAIFKLKPVTLGLLLGGFVILLLILLLNGPQTFLSFFKGFRHLGIKIEPTGYILLAYIWSIFLRIIWVKSLFYYWVFLPNRLELQHGFSESNDSVDRADLRHQIDTDDVILRWWNVGIITFYFPELDRLPITNIMWGIRKKAVFANRIASIISMGD